MRAHPREANFDSSLISTIRLARAGRCGQVCEDFDRFRPVDVFKTVGIRWGFMAKKSVVLCGKKWRGRCDTHDRKCSIPVEFPSGDSRAEFVAEMRRKGAQSHTAESEHRCDLCERERQEGRHAGWYQTDPKDGKVKPKTVVERLERERREKQERIERERRKRQKRHRDSQ